MQCFNFYIFNEIFSEEGCLFLHLYAPLYIEKETAKKIEVGKIDDQRYPKFEMESDEMEVD